MDSMYMLQQRNAAGAGQTLQAGSGRPVTALDAAKANDIFDHFLNASTLKSILGHYRLLCDLLHLRPSTLPNFYPKLKQHLMSWRAKAVWKKFDARANNKIYGKGRTCPETRVLIIGAGPCGLRSAIEAQMLGAKVVVLEKRDRMSRNNVLHLWPFVIDDLRSLGAKKFFGKFCAGSIDHISIRQLQCILLKVALLLGVEIHTEVSYESLVEPSAESKRGWRAAVKPLDHPVSQYEFDVIIGADGKRNTLQGFKRKEFRGKLAIAITANFINRRTEAEARVEEISGVAFIFNQKFFKDLYAETQIDLENIVYYKDDTHYFVMTAKKHSLLSKSVIRSDQGDTARLLSPDNVDRAALMSYAREAAEFSTGRQMLDLEFAVNHYGQPDVAMFDFTSMYAAENASRIVEREGYRLMCILVGDSLLEPFWPTGSGCARGFLSSLDAAWAIRAWGSGAPPLSVLAERESIYRLLGGTTPENLHRDSKSYSLDPSSRYPKLNRQVLTSHQVVGLYDTDDVEGLKTLTQKEEVVVQQTGVIRETAKKRRKVDEAELLSWIKKQVIDYNLQIPDLSEKTFKDGRILCAILHHYRPDLVDYKDLPEDDVLCCHIAIELLEKEIGIPLIISPNEMATSECSRQQVISYLSQIYENFKREIAHINHPKMIFPVPHPEKPYLIATAKKRNPSTPLKSAQVKKYQNKKGFFTFQRRDKEKNMFDSGTIKKTEKIVRRKTFSSNFHKSSTVLEKLDLNFINKDDINKDLVINNENMFSKSNTEVLDIFNVADVKDDNFKDKLLFHCPNIIIKNETNVATNYVKVWSVSDYLLIVPKTASSLVKYFSDPTANNETKATLDDYKKHKENDDLLYKEIDLKESRAFCNISQQNKKQPNRLKFEDMFAKNLLESCKLSGPHCDLIWCKYHKKNSKRNKNGKNVAANKCYVRIKIKSKCGELSKNDLNKTEMHIENLICSGSNLLKHLEENSIEINGGKKINFMTISSEKYQQSNIATLSDDDNKTTITRKQHCQTSRQDNRGQKRLLLTHYKNCKSGESKRSDWVLSKVLKYGAGRHTTNMQTNVNANAVNKVNSKRTPLCYSNSPRSTVSERIRTWLHTNDFDDNKGSTVGTSTVINMKPARGKHNLVDDELKHVEDLLGQQQQLHNDNCTDITGLTSVTKSPPLWGNRIVVDRNRDRESVIRFGPNGEPVVNKQKNEKLPPRNHSNLTSNHRHNNPPKQYRSPTRKTEQQIPNILLQTSPINRNNKEGQQQQQQQNKQSAAAAEDNKIRILDKTEDFDEESTNSMEELAARLMDRFRGVSSGLSNALADHNANKAGLRVIQTISNPFSAITERDDDEVTPTEMPELKQHTLNALIGNTGGTATESPMHHRNFAGLRAAAAPINHHHIRQMIPLGLSADKARDANIITSSVIGGGGSASSAAGRSSRKRKSGGTGAAGTAAGGGGRGDGGTTTGLHVAQWERQQEIDSNRVDRQARRKHHRRSQTEQFLKSMQMLHGNCKPDHSEPFEDYSLFVYRQTAPNFEDRVRDLEKKFIYIPDHTQNQSQLKNERDEDFAARIRHIEDKWYETTAQDPNADRRNITGVAKKPKDLLRAIGKIETSDWNIREIEKKIRENRSGGGGKGGKERVPKWSREQFQARQAKMERKHMLDRQDSTNGKYTELDKNLKLLDQRLKEGTVRDLNQHKVAKITEKLKPKEQTGKDSETSINKNNVKPTSVILPSASNSEYCHFCSKRVYLMEKVSLENRCFHRNCFRCEYCHTLLRPGAYKYDADGKYDHRFYCTHHYGFAGQLPTIVSTRNRHGQQQQQQPKDLAPTPTNAAQSPNFDASSTPIKKDKGEVTPLSNREGGLLGRVTGVDLLDRVRTPERIEFSNLSTGNASSDHEEPPSIMDEDEWTDRNFGASTAEVGTSDEDDSFSDTDSEEEFEEAIEEPATKEGNMRILERYSRFSRKRDSDSEEYSSSEQSSYCENTSGDEESDTATEGEEEIRARELRKQEVRLEPPIITDTGTDTEINSDDTAYSKSNEAPNSATEISTDSEFAQDEPTPTREIPSIVFNDAFVTKSRGTGNITKVHVTSGELLKHNAPVTARKAPIEPPKIVPIVPNDILQTVAIKKPTNLPLLNRLTDGFPLNRTQSTSGIAAMKSLELKKRYLLGETAQVNNSSTAGIQKSGSASTLDSKLKSFHSNISDCQKMLKPTQEVSNETIKMVLSGEKVRSASTDAQRQIGFSGGKLIDGKDTEIGFVEKNGCDKRASSTTNIINPPVPQIAPELTLTSNKTQPSEIPAQPSKRFENELEGRPRSPVHETSIIVPTIDWAIQSKLENDYSDSMSSESELDELQRSPKLPEKPSEAAAPKSYKLAELEPLDSLNYIPSMSDLAPKSISSEKKSLNQPKTLPGLYNKSAPSTEMTSGRSTPTHGGNDSCITGFLTETELSDWARDGAVSDDFDYEYEHIVASRKHKEPKKLGSFVDTTARKDDTKVSLNLLDLDKSKSKHICGKADDEDVVIECVNSILNPDLKNIEYMDTGSENSSCSDEDVKKNNGYVQFYNDNDIAEDSLSPIINNLAKLTVLEVRNPLMTATIDDMADFDELSTPTRNTGFCEVVVTPTPSCNFGGTVVDLKPTDLEELKQKRTLSENEMDSLQVIDTGTEDNTCSDSTVKNVEDFKPFMDNNNVNLDKKRLEDKLMQVKQDMMSKKDSELFVEHCQRLQGKIAEFTNVRDSIDVRKNSQKNQAAPKPDLIQKQPEIRLNLTPTNLYRKEIIAKERDVNQRLIHEMILNKYKTENKSLERKRRSRNNSFSPKTFELSKSATTVDLGPTNIVNTSGNVTPDVILSTTQQNPLQKSQTMAEITGFTSPSFPPKSDSYITQQSYASPQVQQVYMCFQVDKTPSYDKMRQEARAKAKLLSDSDLGLSPEDKILRLRERIRGLDNIGSVATPQTRHVALNRANSNVIIRDTKSGMPPACNNRNSVAESQFNRVNIFATHNNIYSNDTLNSKKRPKSFRRSSVENKAELTTSKSVQNILGGQQLQTFSSLGNSTSKNQATKSFKSDSNLLLDKSLEDFEHHKGGAKKKSKDKDRERRKSITKVISDFFVSIRKDGNSNLNAAKGFLAKISPKARERSKVKETVSLLRKSASSDLHFSSTRDVSPPPVPPLPHNYTGNKLEDSSDAELDFQRHCGSPADNMDPALPMLSSDCVDSAISGNASGSRRNSRGTAKRSARQAQLKRHRTAQEIQRKLEETEVKIRELELDGIAIEKRLRGESTYEEQRRAPKSRGTDCSSVDNKDDGELLRQWFDVMRELTEWRRYERELVTRAEELELEDRHARLQNQLRDKLSCDSGEGGEEVSGTSAEAGIILEEMMDIVAKRDSIIANLEQDKQRYTDEDKEFEEQMIAKGLQFLPSHRKSIDSN